MAFKQISSTQAIISSTHFATMGRKLFALIAIIVTIFMASRLEQEDNSLVILWALGALLTWHLAFAKRQTEIDLIGQCITIKISALYPITKQKIPISTIETFRIGKDPTRINRYNLYITLIKQGDPIRFGFGSQTQMRSLGEKISNFCSLPLLAE